VKVLCIAIMSSANFEVSTRRSAKSFKKDRSNHRDRQKSKLSQKKIEGSNDVTKALRFSAARDQITSYTKKASSVSKNVQVSDSKRASKTPVSRKVHKYDGKVPEVIDVFNIDDDVELVQRKDGTTVVREVVLEEDIVEMRRKPQIHSESGMEEKVFNNVVQDDETQSTTLTERIAEALRSDEKMSVECVVGAMLHDIPQYREYLPNNPDDNNDQPAPVLVSDYFNSDLSSYISDGTVLPDVEVQEVLEFKDDNLDFLDNDEKSSDGHRSLVEEILAHNHDERNIPLPGRFVEWDNYVRPRARGEIQCTDGSFVKLVDLKGKRKGLTDDEFCAIHNEIKNEAVRNEKFLSEMKSISQRIHEEMEKRDVWDAEVMIYYVRNWKGDLFPEHPKLIIPDDVASLYRRLFEFTKKNLDTSTIEAMIIYNSPSGDMEEKENVLSDFGLEDNAALNFIKADKQGVNSEYVKFMRERMSKYSSMMEDAKGQGGWIASLFPKLTNTEAFKTFEEYESIIDMVQSFLLLIYQLSRVKSFLDVYSVVYQYYSIYSSSVIDKMALSGFVATLSSALFIKKKPVIHSQSLSGTLSDGKDFFHRLLSSDLSMALTNMLVTAAGLRLFDKETAFAIFDFVKKPKELTIPDLISLGVDSIISIVKVGEMLLNKVPLHECLFADDPVANAISKARALTNAAPFVYTGLPVEGYMDITEYVTEARNLLRILDEFSSRKFIMTKSGKDIEGARTALKMKLLEKMSKLRGMTRPTPIGLVLCGDPGIGKSGLIDFCGHIYSKVKGRKYSSTHKYVRNVNSEFWEGYESYSHDIVCYPEVGSHADALAKMGLEIAIPELTSVLDSAPFPCNMAKLEDKGNTFFASGLVIIDTNNKDLNLSVLKKNPSAYRRRFIYVVPTVRPELRKPGSTQLDAKAGNGLRHFDKWTFDVFLYHANGSVYSTEEALLVGGNIDQFALVMEKYMRGKMELEQSIVSLRETFAEHEKYGQEYIDLQVAAGNSEFKGMDDIKVPPPLPCYEEPPLAYPVTPPYHEIQKRRVRAQSKEMYMGQILLDDWTKKNPKWTQRINSFHDSVNGFLRGVGLGSKAIYHGMWTMYYYAALKTVGDGWRPNPNNYFVLDKWCFLRMIGINLICWWAGYFAPLFSMFFGIFNINAMFTAMSGKETEKRAKESYDKTNHYINATQSYFSDMKIPLNIPKDYWYVASCVGLGAVLVTFVPMLIRSFFPWTSSLEYYKKHAAELTEMQRRRESNDSAKSEASDFKLDDPLNEVIKRQEESEHQGFSYERVAKGIATDPLWNARVTKFPSAYQEEDSSNLRHKYAANVRQCVVQFEGVSKCTYLFGIQGSFALINTHSYSNKPVFTLKVCVNPGRVDEKAHYFVSLITENDRVELGNDITLVNLSAVTFKNVLPHWIEDDVIPNNSLCFLNSHGPFRAFVEKKIDVEDKRCPYSVERAISYIWEKHHDGACGLPLYVQKDKGWSVCGIHTAGSDQNVAFSSSIKRQLIVEGIARLSSTSLMKINSQSEVFDRINLGAPLPKSPFRYLDSGATYYGRNLDEKVMIDNKSSVKPTIFANEGFLSGLFYDELKFVPGTIYAPPVMKPYVDKETRQYMSPYNIGLEKVFLTKNPCDRSVVLEVENEFRAHILKNLKGLPEKLQPWTVEMAVNGCPSDAYARRVDAGKSAGFGWKGSKSAWIPIVHEDTGKVVREPISKVKEALVYKYTCYQNEQNSGIVHRTQLKDEPRPMDKVKSAKTRLFYMSPLDGLIVARQYLGPIYTLMVEQSEAFCAAIGSNMHMDADDIYQSLTGFAEDFIEGDYSNYDQRMPFDIGWGVSTLVYNLAKELGYNEEALEKVRGVLSDGLFPLVSILGDIFEAPGLQTSGKYATAEDNSLRGVFLMLYAWKMLQREGKIKPFLKFFECVKPLVYGDDVLAAVKPHVKFAFNNLVYANCCQRYFLMDFTSASKDGTLRMFETAKTMSFLKRTFRFDVRLNRYVAPLHMDSIYKTLAWFMPSTAVSNEKQMIDTLSSVMYELWFHLPEGVFTRFREALVGRISQKFQTDYRTVHLSVPTYQKLYTAFKGDVPESDPLDIVGINIDGLLVTSESEEMWYNAEANADKVLNKHYADLKEAEAEADKYIDPCTGLSVHEVRLSRKFHLNADFRDYYMKFVRTHARVKSLQETIKILEKGKLQRRSRMKIMSQSEELISGPTQKEARLLVGDAFMRIRAYVGELVINLVREFDMYVPDAEEQRRNAKLELNSLYVNGETWEKVLLDEVEYGKEVHNFSAYLTRIYIQAQVVERMMVCYRKDFGIGSNPRLSQRVVHVREHIDPLCKEIDFCLDTMLLTEDVPPSYAHITSEAGDEGVADAGPVTDVVVHENIIDIVGDTENKVDEYSRNYTPMLVRNPLTIEDFFYRPLEIASFNIAFNTDLNFKINPWETYLLSPSVRSKLRNYAFIRGDIVLTMKISATPFDYGCILATYLPQSQNNAVCNFMEASIGGSLRPNVIKWLSCARQKILMDADSNKPVEMRCTFIGNTDVIRLMNGGTAITDSEYFVDSENLGLFWFVTLNRFRTLSTAPSEPSVYMQARMENVILGATTSTVLTIASESKELGKGALSGVLMTIAGYAKSFEKNPIIGAYAKASSMISTGLGMVAIALGWSTPQVVEDPTLMKNQPLEADANTIGARTVKSLTLTPSQETTVGPHAVSINEDEMLISVIAREFGLLDMFEWKVTDVPFAGFIWKAVVCPEIVVPLEPVSRSYCQPTPLCFTAMPFTYWHGIIKFYFKVVRTQFHRGVLGILWEPNVPQVNLIASSLSTLKNNILYLDIQQTSEIVVCVEWGTNRMWQELPTQDQMMQGVQDIVDPDSWAEVANGFIGVFVVNEEQSPTGESLFVDVFTASDDIHYNVLISDGLPYDRKMSESLEIKSESLEFKSFSQNEVSCLSINHTNTSTSGFLEDFFGEEPRSFRSLMRRWVVGRSIASAFPAAGPTKAKIVTSILPLVAPVFGAVSSITSGEDLNLWSYLCYMYMSFKGSICWRVHFNTGTMGPTSHVKIRFTSPNRSTQADGITFIANTTAKSQLIGSVSEVPNTQGGVQVRVPWYSSNKFLVPGGFAPFDTGDTMQSSLAIRNLFTEAEFLSPGATTTLVATYEFCLGEDGTFAGLYPPPPFSVSHA
jgi:hypothetical protein